MFVVVAHGHTLLHARASCRPVQRAIKRVLKKTQFRVYTDSCDWLLQDSHGLIVDTDMLVCALKLSFGNADTAVQLYLQALDDSLDQML